MKWLLYSFLLLVIVLGFSSCSKVTTVSKNEITNHYGLNFIDVNSTDQILYIDVTGVGLVDGVSGFTVGYLNEEIIIANPKKCQAILLVNADTLDINKTKELLENICIVRRK